MRQQGQWGSGAQRQPESDRKVEPSLHLRPGRDYVAMRACAFVRAWRAPHASPIRTCSPTSNVAPGRQLLNGGVALLLVLGTADAPGVVWRCAC